MKKFLSLCLASLMILASASTVLADDGIMLISETEEAVAVDTVIPENIVITGVKYDKTAPLAQVNVIVTESWVDTFGNRYDSSVVDPINGTNFGVVLNASMPNGITVVRDDIRTTRIGAFPRQITVKMNVGENGSVDVPAKFFVAASASRTFNITPDAGYKVADITVNGVSYGPAKSVTLKNVEVNMDVAVTFEEDWVITNLYSETFDAETKWVSGGTADAAVLADGKLTVKSTGGDPNINMPEALNLACEEITQIRVKYTNNTENTSFQIFFTNEANPGYSEAGSFKADCVKGENEIIIKTAGNELWTGTLANMRIDLSNGEGEFIVDEIVMENAVLNIPAVEAAEAVAETVAADEVVKASAPVVPEVVR